MTETAQAVKGRIASYWNKSAKAYDTQFGHGIHSDTERDLWLSLLQKNIPFPPGANILDVGCGTGFLSLLLAKLGYNVTGIDLSADMRAQALQKAKKKGLSIHLSHGDAENPQFPANTFDVVISRHVVWTLPNPAHAFSAWKKVLKPEGRVIIIDGVWTPKNLSGRIQRFAMNMIRRLKGGGHGSSWKKEYVRNRSELPFFGGTEPENIQALLKDMGFHNIVLDDMQSILDHERRHGPLEYRITHAKNRRYLISGQRP